MAVVAGVVFFVIRALLALVPGLAVSFPIKTYLFQI
jgi:competence protein ComEC